MRACYNKKGKFWILQQNTEHLNTTQYKLASAPMTHTTLQFILLQFTSCQHRARLISARQIISRFCVWLRAESFAQQCLLHYATDKCRTLWDKTTQFNTLQPLLRCITCDQIRTCQDSTGKCTLEHNTTKTSAGLHGSAKSWMALHSILKNNEGTQQNTTGHNISLQ